MLEEIKAADKPLTPIQQTWLNHLNACDAQGGSSAAYARAHGLSIAALYAARKDLVHRGVYKSAGVRRQRLAAQCAPAPMTFVPVQLSKTTRAPRSACPLRVVLSNGLIIEVDEDAEPGRCAALVSALNGVAR